MSLALTIASSPAWVQVDRDTARPNFDAVNLVDRSFTHSGLSACCRVFLSKARAISGVRRRAYSGRTKKLVGIIQYLAFPRFQNMFRWHFEHFPKLFCFHNKMWRVSFAQVPVMDTVKVLSVQLCKLKKKLLHSVMVQFWKLNVNYIKFKCWFRLVRLEGSKKALHCTIGGTNVREGNNWEQRMHGVYSTLEKFCEVSASSSQNILRSSNVACCVGALLLNCSLPRLCLWPCPVLFWHHYSRHHGQNAQGSLNRVAVSLRAFEWR